MDSMAVRICRQVRSKHGATCPFRSGFPYRDWYELAQNSLPIPQQQNANRTNQTTDGNGIRIIWKQLALKISIKIALSASISLASISSALVPAPSYAQTNDPNSLGPGFVFYDTPQPPPPVQPPKAINQPAAPAPQPTPPPSAQVSLGPPPLSAEWIKSNITKYLDTAVDDPTPQNVTAFLSLQKVMFDRAQNFAEEASYVSQFTPSLNAATYVPIENSGNNDAMAAVDSAKGAIVSSLAQKVGLWFFFKSDCLFCEKQIPEFVSFTTYHHIAAVYVSMDGKSIPGIPAGADVRQNAGQAQELGLVETPSIIMVWPPNNYAVISQGLTSEQGIETVMAEAAAYMNLVSPKLLAAANPYRRGVLTPQELNSYHSGQKISPTQLSTYVTGTTDQQIIGYSGAAPYPTPNPQANMGATQSP